MSSQAKKEKEPAYTVVSEKGEPRSREFVIQCSLDGGAILTQGIGPNKKTAKRKAAEAMLQQLGYSKPQAQQAGLNRDERGWLKPALNSSSDKYRTFPRNGIAKRKSVPLTRNRCLLENIDSTNLNRHEGKSSNSKSGQKALADKQGAIAKELLDNGVSITAMKMDSSERQTSAMASDGGSLIKPRDQLNYLAKVLGIQVSFMNFPKGNEFLSLVALTSNPPQVSSGEVYSGGKLRNRERRAK